VAGRRVLHSSRAEHRRRRRHRNGHLLLRQIRPSGLARSRAAGGHQRLRGLSVAHRARRPGPCPPGRDRR
jgi:hypothetical protein